MAETQRKGQIQMDVKELLADYAERRMRQRMEKLERQGQRFIDLGFNPDELTIVSIQYGGPMNDYVWPTKWLEEDVI